MQLYNKWHSRIFGFRETLREINIQQLVLLVESLVDDEGDQPLQLSKSAGKVQCVAESLFSLTHLT